MNEIQIHTDAERMQKTITDFLELVEEVPWGNSDWQNRQAIVNMELTPERAYRHASLRIMNRLQALNECYFGLRKEEIQIERLRRKIEGYRFKFYTSRQNYDLDKREAEIEIEQIESRRPLTEKFIKDAIREIESLSPVIQKMGKLTREKFEAAEPAHFEQKYRNQIIGKGDAVTGLESIGIDLKSGSKNPKHQTLFSRITEAPALPKGAGQET